MTEALVLVGMSIREVDARDRLVAAAEAHGGTVAFLQAGDPSLSRELTRVADAGTRRIVLVGVSLGTLAPAVSWLRRIAGHWWRERAGHRPTLEVATALMRSEHDLDLVRDVTRPVTGDEAGLSSAAWEQVTGHRHQVLVCRGPRCAARESDRTAESLVLELMEHGLTDGDVLVTQTACLHPCNRAPVVCVQPDDVWYGAVDPDAVRRIVDEHLVRGRPVSTHRLPRASTRTEETAR
jgi:(2Fe-2S) ferredoxin